MQWDLLPGRSRIRPSFSLAGQLEPAYAVCGDHFDWAVNGDWLTVTALNGMGNGPTLYRACSSPSLRSTV